jgi:uncharacterized membrane protein (UPF0127 family)
LRVYKITSPDIHNYWKRTYDYNSLSDAAPSNIEMISSEIEVADSFFTGLFGLIFKRRLKKSEGLLIKKCNSIHTFGMRYCIDIIFLDKFDEITAVFHNLKPFRFTPFIKNASKVLELNSGFINSVPLKIGDRLYFEN